MHDAPDVIVAGHADAQALRVRPQLRHVVLARAVGRIRVARVVARHGIHRDRNVLGGVRHRADVIERIAERADAELAHETEGRLEP